MMILRSNRNQKSGQNLAEYALVLGSIAIVILAMGPMLKRGTNGMIKLMADQIGNQQEADQIRFTNKEEIFEAKKKGGFLVNSMVQQKSVMDSTFVGDKDSHKTVHNDEMYMNSKTVTNLGYSEQ